MAALAGAAGMAAGMAAAPTPSALRAASAAQRAPEPEGEIVVVAPWAGIPQPVGRDEEGLWLESDEAERRLQPSARRIRDAGLEAHVKDVLCRTVGADRCRDVRIYLVRIPLFNAGMWPNGAMELWSGALFRLASDDELAVLLAHEFAHFEKRHSLGGFREARRRSDAAVWTAMLGVPLLPETMIAGYFAFSREQEKEADMLSLAYLRQGGWPEDAATRLWERLVGEARATSVARGHRPDRLLRTGMFDTHPGMVERAAYLKPGAGAATGVQGASVAAWRAALAGVWWELVQDQFGRNDFAGTDHVLDQLIALGPHPDLLLAKAELYRRRGHPRDIEVAVPLYRAALAAPDARPEARRGLGLALLKAGDRGAGLCELDRYLQVRPEAPDAQMLRAMVEDGATCADF